MLTPADATADAALYMRRERPRCSRDVSGRRPLPGTRRNRLRAVLCEGDLLFAAEAAQVSARWTDCRGAVRPSSATGLLSRGPGPAVTPWRRAFRRANRYEHAGLTGRADRSSRSKTSPRRTEATVADAIAALRRQRPTGKHIAMATGVSEATVSRGAGTCRPVVAERPHASLRIKVQRVMTDNGSCYRAKASAQPASVWVFPQSRPENRSPCSDIDDR
jgi:hypothetical protein